MTLECDVLVVGAGPAGSSAARAAALAGAKTILIEEHPEIGKPVHCAEGISNSLLPLLPFKIPQTFLKWKIDGVVLHAEGISVKRGGGSWTGYTIDRYKFDSWLAEEARKAGVKIMTSATLTDLDYDNSDIVKNAIVKTPNSNIMIKLRFVIAADSSEATTLKLLGKYKPHEGAIAEVYEWKMKNLNLRNPHYEQVFIFGHAPGGYGYIFPHSKKSANVGFGHSYVSKSVEAEYKEFLELPIIKEQVKDGIAVQEKSGKAVVRDMSEEWFHGNALLAGDAANQNIKPFIEGILPAVICGDLAGRNFNNPENYVKSITELGIFEGSDEIEDIVHHFGRKGTPKDMLILLGVFSNIYTKEEIRNLEQKTFSQLREEILALSKAKKFKDTQF